VESSTSRATFRTTVVSVSPVVARVAWVGICPNCGRRNRVLGRRFFRGPKVVITFHSQAIRGPRRKLSENLSPFIRKKLSGGPYPPVEGCCSAAMCRMIRKVSQTDRRRRHANLAESGRAALSPARRAAGSTTETPVGRPAGSHRSRTHSHGLVFVDWSFSGALRLVPGAFSLVLTPSLDLRALSCSRPSTLGRGHSFLSASIPQRDGLRLSPGKARVLNAP
jgi:hypothetical protein